MKKLIIAIATLAMTVSVKAAVVNWTTDFEVCDGTGVDTAFTAATMAYLIDAETITQSSIYSDVSKGKTLSDVIGANSIASASMSGGMISEQSISVNATGNKTYYMVLFDSTLGDNGALYFSEQVIATLSPVGTTSYGFSSGSSLNSIASDMTGFSASDGGWVAVPEPTSGMLLLLGFAGLALRRRRA